MAVDSADNLYIADFYRIRKVSGGVITTVAGGPSQGFSGDGGAATSARIGGAEGLAVDSDGNLYFADGLNHRIRKVSGGVITTVAGGPSQGFSGDGGAATSARIGGAEGLAVDADGNLYFADGLNHRIRKVSGGVITTVAGGGFTFGDNCPATSAALYRVSSLGVDSAGNVYFADPTNSRVQLLEPQP